jgi:hypothetical protein
MNSPVPIAVVAALRERIRCLEGGARHRRAVLPFGIKAIDERLPEGGLALGALHEVAGGGDGAIDGAAAALFAAGIAARTRGRVLWCVTRQDLFAPAIASAGLAPDRVIYVEAGDEKSVLACFEEGLRHAGLGAVVAEVARLSMTASRRLQLAAEGSGAIGIAIRRGGVIGAGVSFPTLDALHSVIARERASEEFGRSIGRSVLLLLRRRRVYPTSAPQEGSKSATADFDGDEGRKGGKPRVSALRPAPLTPTLSPLWGEREMRLPSQAADFGQPTAAVTRWRVSALPSQPLPVPGVGRARWRLELIRCRGGESACFEVEACDAKGRLALPSDLVNGSGQKAIGRRRTAR